MDVDEVSRACKCVCVRACPQKSALEWALLELCVWDLVHRETRTAAGFSSLRAVRIVMIRNSLGAELTLFSKTPVAEIVLVFMVYANYVFHSYPRSV